MKIAVISTTIFSCPPKGYSGLELIAFLCAEGLAKKGHEVTLYAPNGSKCDYARVRQIGPPGQIDEWAAYGGYWQELPGYDCIIDHTWLKSCYMLKMEGKLPNPILGVMHAPVNTMYQTLPPIEKPCMVCISRDQASHFEALFERPARVAHNGVDFSFYKPIEGIKRNNRFLFLARFSRVKSPHLAIDTCKAVDANLDLVGDTSITNEPDYLDECMKKCDPVKIRLVGPANRGECVKWFSQSLAFIHPTRDFREPFGLAPVEAQGCALPVIAWNRGGVRETVLHNQTGWLVNSEEELSERIKQVATDGISNQMRKECIDWVRSVFTVDKMVTRYEALCTEAIEVGW